MSSSPRPHFLLLVFPLQGYITPSLRLAERLLAAAPDALVTFSTNAAAHSRMFPAAANDDDGSDGRLEFLPFSDGSAEHVDVGSVVVDAAACNAYMASFHAASERSAGELMDALRARGRPVSRVVYTLMLPWAADVARARGFSSALFWPQTAAVFAAYYHYFHGHAGVVDERRHDPSFVVRLPGLPPLAVGDLPSFITESTDPSHVYHSVFTAHRDHFHVLDRETTPTNKATVLVNTCEELEEGEGAVAAYNVLPVGPVLPSDDNDVDEAGLLFELDSCSKYMEWLDTKQARSIVYVSFGSLVMAAREQLVELITGLEESGRPYLFVVRKDNKQAVLGEEMMIISGDHHLKNGIMVEWCDQVRVLSHAAVGCFVTHCGWNSVVESMACGVPIVGMPHFSEQRMNAQLVERKWHVGVRALLDNTGLLRAAELRRCIEEVMGNGESPAKVRRNVREWQLVIRKATEKQGSSDSNLMDFVQAARS